MTDDGPRKAFENRGSFDQPELVGARWWRRSVEFGTTTPAPKGTLAQLALAAGIIGAIGVVAAVASSSCDDRTRPGAFDETSITRDSIEAQRTDRWDVDDRGATLDYPDSVEVDAVGERDAEKDGGLARELAPERKDLAPYYVSTLFQSIELASNARLRAGLKPISSLAMNIAFARGESVRSLFEGVDRPKDVALVVDLPGPESVAFAAGLGAQFDPVFVFDNWPHPRGVVPSHLTLAASVYYRRWFARHAPTTDAPPAFVLDHSRLNPYVDDAGRFDNRYLARLPSADGFKSLGIAHVLYVAMDGATAELDDLNDDFVALAAAGIDVKILPLSDLMRSSSTTNPAQPSSAAAAPAATARTYHYGGHPYTHWWFWNSYGWRRTPTAFPASAPTGVSRGYDFKPTTRPTIFSSGGAARPVSGETARPRGFGTTTFHKASESTGSSGRSGSYGRSGSSASG